MSSIDEKDKADDIPRKNKIAIIERQLIGIKNTLYELRIQVRVAEKVSDINIKNQAVEQMKRFEKMKDEYELILQELIQGDNN